MPIGVIDGFDHYPDKTTLGIGLFSTWIQVGGDRTFLVAGRVGGQAIRYNDDFGSAKVYRDLPASDECSFFWGIAPISQFVSTTNQFIRFCTNNAYDAFHFGLRIGATGALEILNYNSVVIHTEPGFFTLNSWSSMSVVAKIHESTGILQIRRNGELVIDMSNLNLKNPSYTTVTGVLLGWASHFDFDDFRYDYDTLVPIPEGRSIQTTVNADVEADWTRLSGGSNYLMVDETTCDDDTTYNSTSTIDARDLFSLAGLGFNPDAIHAVQLIYAARKDDVATRVVQSILKSDSEEVLGAENYLTTNYTWSGHIFELDPNGDIPWTKESVEALQIGYQYIDTP